MSVEMNSERTAGDKRPGFFQIELPILWKESSEA